MEIKTDRVIQSFMDSSQNKATIDHVLQFIEENLDTDHLDKLRKKLKQVINYETIDTIPLKVQMPCNVFKPFPFREAYYNREMMMINELLDVCNSVQIKDATMPMIRANYGVPIMPSLFGLTYKITSNNLPWVNYFNSRDEVRRLVDEGVPSFNNGLGKEIFNTHEYYKSKLSKYPKCNKYISIYHPDMQGPIDIAHLIWGNDIYYAFYDVPELVHDLLKLVTQTYIQFIKEIKKSINDEDEEFLSHWGTLYKGKVVIRDDTAVNLSPELYEEFVKPYDELIIKSLNGGCIHYCGRGDHLVFKMMECNNLLGLNFGQPPNMQFGVEFIKEIYNKAKEKNIAILGYYLDKKELVNVIKSKFNTGVTYRTVADNVKEASELINICKQGELK